MFAVKYTGYGFIGILYGVIASAALLISASGFREKPDIIDNKSTISPIKAIQYTFKNKPFIRLIIAYLIMKSFFCSYQNAHGILSYLSIKDGERSAPLYGFITHCGGYLHIPVEKTF